jgi:hypothetical protein
VLQFQVFLLHVLHAPDVVGLPPLIHQQRHDDETRAQAATKQVTASTVDEIRMVMSSP